mgnify:CR=1 FL=1
MNKLHFFSKDTMLEIQKGVWGLVSDNDGNISDLVWFKKNIYNTIGGGNEELNAKVYLPKEYADCFILKQYKKLGNAVSIDTRIFETNNENFIIYA